MQIQEREGGNSMRRRMILLLTVALVTIFSLTGCGDSKEELRAELDEVRSERSELQDEVATLEDQVSALELENAALREQADADANETYLALVFTQDGNFYKASDENFKFYSDQACENALEDVRLVSSVVEERTRKNGFVICVCLSDQGLVYSTSWPSLIMDNES